ncbi:MAG: 6,7-dimethyl-8-ribityllumazine synthase [Polyangiaceae bacterium]|nr:6,7-dimethyl-8-ribityllumazine synthase [Polyangiaceae bacterium]
MTHDLQRTARVVEGVLVAPPGARFALVATRFNQFIVERLVDGALDALTRHGAQPDRCTIVRVPGSWEVPVVCARLAASKSFDAIVALAAVIRGGTPHFDYVAAEVTKGIAQVALQTGVPVTFGVLTTDTIEQAVDRAGTKAGNKGFDAAVAAIEMVSLASALTTAGL